MASKTKRSLQAVGSANSLSMTLPKPWVQFWNLSKKQRVQVFYNGVLVVLPDNNPELAEKVRNLLK